MADTAVQRQIRILRNRTVAREVNERIVEFFEDADLAEFLCECGEGDCIQTIELSVEEYVRRASHSRFVVCPAHLVRDIYRAVEETESYVVVERVEPSS